MDQQSFSDWLRTYGQLFETLLGFDGPFAPPIRAHTRNRSVPVRGEPPSTRGVLLRVASVAVVRPG